MEAHGEPGLFKKNKESEGGREKERKKAYQALDSSTHGEHREDLHQGRRKGTKAAVATIHKSKTHSLAAEVLEREERKKKP